MKTSPPFQYDAVVAGYLGVDITPGFPPSCASIPLSERLRPGKLVEVEGLSLSLGGVVANTGLAMRKFGKRVALMGRVGHDILGDVVLARLRKQGGAFGIRRTDRGGTAYGIVLAPPGTDRMFLEDPGCNRGFTSRDIDYTVVAWSRLFHFGYPTLMKRLYSHDGAELRKLFAGVRKRGVATSLDMTLPDPDSPAGKVNWRKLLAAVLPCVDIFMPSIEELLFMMEPKRYRRLRAKAGRGDVTDSIPPPLYDSMAGQILGLGVKVLLVKAGHRGAYLRTGDAAPLAAAMGLKLPAGHWSHRRAWIPAFPADPRRIRNTCGAGDCAVAGFLAALLEGVDIETAGRYAMLAGRDTLYGVDALSGLSEWQRMTKELARLGCRRTR